MTSPQRLSLMVLFTVSAFAGAGTIHYQTPMLAAFAAEFGADPAAAGWVATLSFGGFLLGTIFFVPLGDRFDKRRLILAELSVLIVALLAMAAAPSLATLAGAVLLDCGLRAALVANVTLVTSVAPDARSRFNTVFGAHLWAGNTTGAFLASTALAYAGWLAVCAIAVSASCLALLVQWRSRPPSP